MVRASLTNHDLRRLLHRHARRVDPGPLLATMVAAACAFGVTSLAAGGLAGLGAALAVFPMVWMFRTIGWRGVVVGTALFVTPPGVLGESSFKRALSGLLVILVVTILTPPEDVPMARSPILRTIMFTVPALVGTAFWLGWTGFPFIVAAYGVVAVLACLWVSRPHLIMDVGKFIILACAFLAGSYTVSMMTGFKQLTTLQLNKRTVSVAFPMTPNTNGSTTLAYPRLVILTGEPGLNVFFLILAIATIMLARRQLKILGLLLVVLVCYYSQSTGTLLAAALGLVCSLTLLLIRARRFEVLAALYAFAALVGPAFYQSAVGSKASANPASLNDRGLGASGTAANSGAGDINLLRTYSEIPVIASLIIIALVIIVALSLRTVVGAGLAIVFTATCALLQPIQWHFGAWLMMLAALILCEYGREKRLLKPFPRRART